MATRRHQSAVVAAVALFALVFASTGGVEASRPLDCSNAYSSASLSTLQTICSIADGKLYGEPNSENALIRLETVETCACALVNHELVWASIMTHENEALYLSIKQFVEQWDAKYKDQLSKDQFMPQRDKNVMFKGRDGDRRYLWFRLNDILRNANGELDDEEISLMIRENFSKIYYDVDTFRVKYNSGQMVQSQKLRSTMAEACKIVVQNFADTFYRLFQKLSELANNEHFLFSLTAYNDNLYKIRQNSKVCLYLFKHGQLTMPA